VGESEPPRPDSQRISLALIAQGYRQTLKYFVALNDGPFVDFD
jgi:hypothetical protein